MADGVQHGTGSLLPAPELARTLTLDSAPNGIRYTSFGETKVADAELERIVQAVPAAIAPALALAFEFFINVGHLFAEAVGIPEDFTSLAWKQALSDVRGETSQDAYESRTQALGAGATRIDEKAKTDFLDAAFADAVAIYLLSLAVDFDYAELREREYPLLAPNPLADRLRLMAKLFPPNPGYDFSIRYRRR